MILNDIIAGGKPALAKALALIESAPEAPETTALLDEAYLNPKARVIGMTGPPGVGKSTLLNTLVREWRARDLTVGCIAVDPSSRRSKGALLGDRTRLTTDPSDQGVFFRSMAARDRLGGLAGLTIAAMVLMRAVYDVVLIETVGVGQSETDVAQVADTVLFCVQPGSGDSLQFMKAGIAEIPHVVCITKADMQNEALRARADVKGALSLAAGNDQDQWTIPVVLVSSQTGQGMDELLSSLDRHYSHLIAADLRDPYRTTQAQAWLQDLIMSQFGRKGLDCLRSSGIDHAPMLQLSQGESPFGKQSLIAQHLHIQWR